MTVRHFINTNNCDGGGFSANFRAYGTDPNTYTWSPTDGLTATSGAVVRAAPTTTTTYTLTVTTPLGCLSTDQVTVTVNPNDLAGLDRFIRCGDSIYIGVRPMPHGIITMPRVASTRDTTRNQSGILRDHANHLYVNAVTPHLGVRYMTIAPFGADSVEMVFRDMQTTGFSCGDQITIFDGYDEQSVILYGPITTGSIPLNTRVVSRTGVMTIRHNINTSNCDGRGFEANFRSWGNFPDDQYLWSPASGLSNPTVANPLAAPAATTTYTLTYANGCTDQVTVFVEPSFMAGPNVTISCGDSAYIGVRPMPYGIVTMPLLAASGTTVRDTLRNRSGILRDHANHLNVNQVTPHQGTRYMTLAPVGADSVEVVFNARGTSGFSCGDHITIYDGYDESAPVLYGPITVGSIPLGTRIVSTWGVMTIRHFINTNNCDGIGFEATYNSFGTFPDYYSWTPTTGLSDPTVLNPKAAPTTTTVYTLTYGGPGGCTDQVIVTVLPLDMAGPNVTIACGDSAFLGVRPMPHGIITMPLLAASGTTVRDTVRNRNGILRDHANHLNVHQVPPHQGTRFMTLAPVCADSVEILFNATGTTGFACGDHITIYDGFDETAPILYGPMTVGSIPAGTRVVSTWGVMTIRHFINTNNCDGIGFEATYNSFGTFPDYYSWTPTTGLSDPTALNPRAAPSTTTTYTLTYGGPGGCTDEVTVTVVPLDMAGPDRNILCGDSVYIGVRPMPHGIIAMPLLAASGTTVRDTVRNRSGILRDHANQLNVNQVTPHQGTRFMTLAPVGADSVEMVFTAMETSGFSCGDHITIYDGYDETAPVLYGPITVSSIPVNTRIVSTWGVMTIRHFIDTNNCDGIGFEASYNSFGSYPDYYSWTPTTALSPTTGPWVRANPTTSTNYTLTVQNSSGCTITQLRTLTVSSPTLTATPATILCGDTVQIGGPP
jgi:hypothetical protein